LVLPALLLTTLLAADLEFAAHAAARLLRALTPGLFAALMKLLRLLLCHKSLLSSVVDVVDES
jgi:hypothetical protein